MLRADIRLMALVVAASLAAAFAVSSFLPRKYSASARVLLPAPSEQRQDDYRPLAERGAAQAISVSANGASRMLLISHVSQDPRAAAERVNEFLDANLKKGMTVIDRAAVAHAPISPDLRLNLAAGGAAGLALGLLVVAARRRKPKEVPAPHTLDEVRLDEKSEEPAAGTGDPDALARQLAQGWFARERVLAIAGPGARESRSRFAARLAVSLAALGEKTLLVDGAGCASDGVHVKPVDGVENLYLLLGTQDRLPRLIAEASRRFRAILVDAPEGDSGAELESLAALAGGALIVAPGNADPGSLERLRESLLRARASVVGTVSGVVDG